VQVPQPKMALPLEQVDSQEQGQVDLLEPVQAQLPAARLPAHLLEPLALSFCNRRHTKWRTR